MKGLSIEIWKKPTGESRTFGGGLMGGASWYRTARLLKDGAPITEWVEPTKEFGSPSGLGDAALRAELAFLARGAGHAVSAGDVKRVWAKSSKVYQEEQLRDKAERTAKRAKKRGKPVSVASLLRKYKKDRYGQPMAPWIGTSGWGGANAKYLLGTP